VPGALLAGSALSVAAMAAGIASRAVRELRQPEAASQTELERA
jgi:hypothetical protein